MIHKSQITFDAHSQMGGSKEVRILGEELLLEEGPIEVTSSVFWKLPFRLRLGPRTVFEVGGVTPARITVINSIDITNTGVLKKPFDPMQEVRPEMASDVLITLRAVKIDDDAKVAIVKALGHSDYSKVTPLYVHPEDPIEPLNSLLIAYRVILAEEVRWNRVRRVLRRDVSSGSTYELHVFKRKHDNESLRQIEEGIAGAMPKSNTPFVIGGAMHDITDAEIAELKASLSRIAQYAFYSFAIQAQDYIQQTDYLNALLYSIIAFENAHAELVEHVVETRAGCEAARKWARELLRRSGISAMVRLTPFLFMTPENRPSDMTIDAVVHAINIRNELAHAKRDKERNLKVNGHRSDELVPLIEEVFSYMNAIARELPD